MRFRNWVIIAAGLLVIGLCAGVIIGFTMPPAIISSLLSELEGLQELGLMYQPFLVSTAVFIFTRNATTLLLSFFLSPLLCIFPFVALTFNGLLLSFVSVIIAREESIGYVIAGILPHGILEIPAIILGEAAALSFGVGILAALFSKKRRGSFTASLRENFKYLGIALALLVPAAIIETFVTPLLIQV
jgi:stage II sporulation protein M